MMNIHWAHSGPSFVASFLACLVECVEALTVVLAVGSVRSWSGALSGSVTAVAVLLALIAALGNTLTRIPLHTLQLVVGALLLLFGLRWLRKAILRSAGQIPLHDEQAAFAKNTAAMQKLGGARGWDRVAFAAAFQITMLEGTEVVFIVIAIGAGGAGLLVTRKRPRNAPVGSGRFVMDSVYERRVWSGGWSSWPRGDRAVGRFVSDEWDGTK
jgi:uncharacterized membrane protein